MRSNVFAFAVIVSVLTLAPVQADDADLAKQAHKVLLTYCYPCHGQNGTKERGIDFILNAEKLRDKEKVVPNKPDESKIYLRMKNTKDPMPPPEFAKRPSEDEIKVIKAWINDGAVRLIADEKTEPERKTITFADTTTAVHAYLEKLPAHERSRQRFLSLATQHNSKKLRAEDLQAYRAAVSKLLNSLSWRPIHVPELIDADKTIFVIDLGEYGWDKAFWGQLVLDYPYGLTHMQYPEAGKEFRNRVEQVIDWTGTQQVPIPIVRADWFVFQASRTPLYDKLMGIPKTVAELEKKLGVDRERNILDLNVARAGFVKSGVSANNRVVERHRSTSGAYWMSYDFKNSVADRNILRFPLGPKFDTNPQKRHAFDFDGGEIIFSLPNGLQGYMVADAEGNWLEKPPPIEIVRDLKQTAGSPNVVNGVSCMACHSHGMITEFKDEIRLGSGLKGDAGELVATLYVEDEKMRKLLAKDQDRFLKALDWATGPFWRTGSTDKRDIRIFPEPVGQVAKSHALQELDLADVAAELGLADTKPLLEALKLDVGQAFSKLGLGTLKDGGTIKRDSWESVVERTSRFQETAKLLKVGTPCNDPNRKNQK